MLILIYVHNMSAIMSCEIDSIGKCDFIYSLIHFIVLVLYLDFSSGDGLLIAKGKCIISRNNNYY